ncbi:MAG: AAA family ATPase [Pseudomonadota bacterium]
MPQLAKAAFFSNLHDHLVVLKDNDGVPLEQTLNDAPMELSALLALALQLSRVIAAMHRCGVIHKNINPSNILLCGPQGLPVLIDFHLATTIAEEQPGFVHHGMIAGTLAYISPEQTGRTGHGVDQRADLYSFGVTLYELATGHPPFAADDTLQLIHDQLVTVPTSPIALVPDLPQALSDIIMRLLEKESDRRYQSADGLAHDLSHLIEKLARRESAPFPLGQRDFALRLAAPSRLMGRDREIAALGQAFEKALHGQGHVVLVTGASGVGKTALINELRPMVTAQRGWFVSGKFDQYRHDAPTATLQALRALGRLLLAEPSAELALHRSRILDALGPNAGLACGLPEFALLLGPQPEVVTIDPAQAEARLSLTTVALLRAIVSAARPLVMVLDDLQWASPISIRLIDNVLNDARLPGLLILGAYRSAEVDATHPLSGMLPRWERLDTAPLQLKLENLPPADLSEMLAEMLRLPPAAAAQLADAVSANTSGNPFDTVELVNALRRDGVLVSGNEGWHWDVNTIRRYIGRDNVVDLLSTRVARLPAASQRLLEILACLGGEVELRLLQAATGLPLPVLEEQLLAPLEDGLLVLEKADDSTVRFRHDRVQQAAYGELDPAQRNLLHLAIARRLFVCPEFSATAAEQYLAAVLEVHEADECRRVASLFHEVAAEVRRSANYSSVERFLGAALLLLADAGTQRKTDKALLTALQIEHHAALYSLGRLEVADGVYRVIEAHVSDALTLVNPVCVQMNSLTSRGRPRDALALGRALLQRLGYCAPEDDMQADIAPRLAGLRRWIEEDVGVDYRHQQETVNPYVRASARLIDEMTPPAFFSDPAMLTWLVLETQRLWSEHGFCAAMVGPLGHAGLITISTWQDHHSGYTAVQHVLKVGEIRGYEPETSRVRFLFAMFAQHWFEPLESCIHEAQRAREGLLQGGNLLTACFTYTPTLYATLECAPSLETVVAETEAALVFAARTGNHQAASTFTVFRQFLRALRGETSAYGSFSDTSFDEATYVANMRTNQSATRYFHIMQALAAALFSEPEKLASHSAMVLPLMRTAPSYYSAALAQVLQALALAEQIKGLGAEERIALFTELDACCDWLALRAADCPVNFLHLLKLVEAERAWALDNFQAAACLFDTAQREASAHQRPWHQALITERAGLFHLTGGMALTGELLLAQARDRYQAWGARAKVEQLERIHGFLRNSRSARLELKSGQNASISADTIDTLAILRASQALSSQTSVARLKASVVKLLCTLTGATTVRFALWDEDAKDWFLSEQPDTAPICVEEAGARGLLPLAAFRYAERTRLPLLVEDATRDDRFARDLYIAGLAYCSLLVVPILNQGVLRAVLLLENQLSRGAFSTDRLDAVMLIAGQLAVSLENALLYQELEQRVQQRTRELRETQAELVGTARRAGMAEIATNVLHNVGNVLNSVNVSAGLITSSVRASKIQGLSRAVQMMNEHAADLGVFLTSDDKGKRLPAYLSQLAQVLVAEHQGTVEQLGVLSRSVDHIKEIIAIQQTHAGTSSLMVSTQPHKLVEEALHMNAATLTRHHVCVVKEFAPLAEMELDKGRILQILVNLIGNAKQAMDGMVDREHRITLSVCLTQDQKLRIGVADNGVGIAPENLTRVFAHGFTTKKDGHGFGLHSAVIAAQEMGGVLTAHSDGPGTGAMFTLELPIKTRGVIS